MIEKLMSLILCGIILLCFVACNDNITYKTSSTKNLNTTSILEENQSTKTYDTLFDTYPSVFITENITSITFYAYYGEGKGSKVPKEYMNEIINWLDSFTIERKATDEDVADGTNNYYVEIEYSDKTIIKEGLDMVFIDGTRYLLEKESYPNCFMDIISKTSLE